MPRPIEQYKIIHPPSTGEIDSFIMERLQTGTPLFLAIRVETDAEGVEYTIRLDGPPSGPLAGVREMRGTIQSPPNLIARILLAADPAKPATLLLGAD